METVTKNFHGLKGNVPQIIKIEGGADINFPGEDGLNGKKYTHCFIVTVKNEENLIAYGAHPKHQAFSQWVDPLLEEVMVVDYYTN